jgi:dihydrofolate reductase
MRKIVYYVASSIDGFISGYNNDISGFVTEGNGVSQYVKDLANFDTVMMGKNTYEFGYQYGLKPGQPAYPNMNHYIFSNSLVFENADPKVHVKKIEIKEIDNLKNQTGTDIYLCGGGTFAGWLLDHQKIDILKLKLNPLILGEGIRIFGKSSKKYSLQLVDTGRFENGLQINTYQIKYNK